MVETSPLADELFSHDIHSCFSDSRDELGKKICKCDFINRINYANFENIPLTVIFKHKRFGRTLSLKGLPDPYIDKNLDLTWIDSIPENENLSQFQCERILIPSFGKYLAFFADDYLITSDGMTLTPPESAYELINRKKIREEAFSTEAIIIQNGTMFTGFLKNFNSNGFLVGFEKENMSQYKLLNREEKISLLLKKEGELLFSGICSILQYRDQNGVREYVLQSISTGFKRFIGKEYRGERYTLNSPLQISFIHPLSNLKKKLRVNDLSGSGLSLLEISDKATLFAGLVIPQLKILLPGNNYISCKAQVIYSLRGEDNQSNETCSGLAILDMEPLQYSKLLDFIHHDLDDRAHVSNEVDMSALWKFFFESGFIYPEKYKYLLTNKEKIKSLYEKLYTEHPGIARHFIYQKDDHIQGHLSMLRSYENSWMIHHHAASTIDSQYSGLHVLNQMGSFTNNSHRIESMHLNYIMCYYRRENKFPNRIYGGLANNIGDYKKCSLDDWGYYHININDIKIEGKTLPFSITEITEGELKDLKCIYENISGGLMLEAFNIENGISNNQTLLKDYYDSGFTREIKLYSLKINDVSCAIIMIDQSEAGLNMSELTNSFKVFITNPVGLNTEIINYALGELSSHYEEEEKIPVLVYPVNQAEDLNLPIEKNYTLCILNMEATDSYFYHLKKLIRNIRY